MMKNTILAMMLLAILAAVACGGGGGGDSSPNGEAPQGNTDPIIIGVAGAHSGDLAAYGLTAIEAAEMAAERFNASGGVLGREVEVLSGDDACRPELAPDVARTMVDEAVHFVLGHTCSGATQAALPIYTDSNIIAISPSATNPQLTQSGEYPTFFRTIVPDNGQASLSAAFATEALNAARIAILHDDSDYGSALAAYVQTYIGDRIGAEAVLLEEIDSGAADFTATIVKVEQTEADCVIFWGYHPEAARIIEQMRLRGMDIPLICSEGVKDEQFILTAGQYAEGVYATGPRDISSIPMYQSVTQDYLSRYGDIPDAFFYNGYAAAIAGLTAIENAGSTDSDAIMQALRSDTVDTPLGPISFDENGDAIGIDFSIYQVQDGVFVELDFER